MVCLCGGTAVRFPRNVESTWLLTAALGFLLDVLVYHTFTLLVKAVIKMMVRIQPQPSLQ